MKRYNSISLKSFLIMVGVIVATFFASMGCAYAYFTATATQKQNTIRTAIISVGFTSSTTIQDVSKPFTITEKIYPGSTIKIKGGVENKGTYKVWAILELQVEVNGEVVEHSYYTANGVLLSQNETGYTTSATEIDVGLNASFNLSYTISSDYGNSYMGQSVEVSVVAHAIQHANISDGVSAVNIMLGTN